MFTPSWVRNRIIQVNMYDYCSKQFDTTVVVEIQNIDYSAKSCGN